jgi:hypothetical protein
VCVETLDMFEIAKRFRSWLDGTWSRKCRRARPGDLEIGRCVSLDGLVAKEVMADVKVRFTAYIDVWICIVSICEEFKREDHRTVRRVFKWHNSQSGFT